MHNVTINSYPMDNLSNHLVLGAPCDSTGMTYIAQSMTDVVQGHLGESLVYHLLQSVNVYVDDCPSKVILLATSGGRSTT
jgi:hypothetical protein